jgi:hypothetical protein
VWGPKSCRLCVSELRPLSRSRSRDLGFGFGFVALLYRVQLHSVHVHTTDTIEKERGEKRTEGRVKRRGEGGRREEEKRAERREETGWRLAECNGVGIYLTEK